LKVVDFVVQDSEFSLISTKTVNFNKNTLQAFFDNADLNIYGIIK